MKKKISIGLLSVLIFNGACSWTNVKYLDTK